MRPRNRGQARKGHKTQYRGFGSGLAFTASYH